MQRGRKTSGAQFARFLSLKKQCARRPVRHDAVIYYTVLRQSSEPDSLNQEEVLCGGLRMFSGSHDLRSRSIATSSAGVRTKLSHGALAIPCSAEIVPPKDVARRQIASSASGCGAQRSRRRMLTCTLPSAMCPNRIGYSDGSMAASAAGTASWNAAQFRNGTATSHLAGMPAVAIASVWRSRHAHSSRPEGPSAITASSAESISANATSAATGS